MSNTNTIETIATLQKATQLLAGVCDGARNDDGAGFNGVDAGFGHSLAEQERWSPKQALAAQKMLGKYSKQLAKLGVDIMSLPVLSMESIMNERAATTPKDSRPVLHEVRPSACGRFIEFHFPFDMVEKDFVKHELRARFVNLPSGKFWSIFADAANWELIKQYAERFGASIHESLQDDIGITSRTAEMAESFELSQALDADISDIDLGNFKLELYPFQRAGVKYALQKRKAIIGDDMGLGKTLQALATIAAAKNDTNFIVVCPASVKLNWQREIAKAMDNVSTAIWTTKSQPDADCIIVNYDILTKVLHKLIDRAPAAIVFDEVHYLKSGKAQRTKAAAELVKGVDMVLMLTGTLIMNRPAELITPLTMLDKFNAFGGWNAFVRRYCQAFQRNVTIRRKDRSKGFAKIWDISGAANLQELSERLRSLCMIRRRKSEVLTELPSKIRAQQVFEIDNRAEYNMAKDNLVAYVEACAAEDAAFLETLKGLSKEEREELIRQHQSDESVKAERAEQLVMIETLKQLATEGKMAGAIDWIANFLDSDQKLVVFAIHISAQKKLLEAFPNAARIMGEDNAETRQSNIDRFRTDDNCRLMVASLGAGGTGVNGLQDVCSNVAFLELGWTPAIMMQAEDRIHRIGQDGQVTAWYLLAENTIEEDIQTRLAAKQAVIDSALDGAPETANGSVFNELIEGLKVDAGHKPRKTRKGGRR